MQYTAIKNVEKANKERYMGYATTIRDQLKYPNLNIYHSWGAYNFCLCQSADENNNPCLMFRVDGMKFQGFVFVFYNWADYYDIEFVSLKGELFKRIEEVYAFDLQATIDEVVEKINEYIY